MRRERGPKKLRMEYGKWDAINPKLVISLSLAVERKYKNQLPERWNILETKAFNRIDAFIPQDIFYTETIDLFGDRTWIQQTRFYTPKENRKKVR